VSWDFTEAAWAEAVDGETVGRSKGNQVGHMTNQESAFNLAVGQLEGN
jgi:hypothetical protein